MPRARQRSQTILCRVRWPRREIVALLTAAVLLLAACGTAAPQSLLDELATGTNLGSTTLAQMVRQRGTQNSAEAFARQQLLLRQAANWYLSRMSLDAQLGQMLLDESDGTVYSPDMAIMVERQQIGGMIIFGDNFGTFDQTHTLFQQVQAHATIPLFIATDQEGGGITRIGQYYGSFPSPRELGDSGSLQNTYAWGQRTALDLQALGINTNLAPVVDVSVNGGEPWSATRTFSEDPHVVATYAGAFMQGERSVGEVTALKHFPGLGSVTLDPHLTLPIVDRTWAQLQQTELYPYAALVAQHPDMIMSTDVEMTAVDPVYPAELSQTWINGILRHKLGYDGIVITDALWMKGIADTWSLGQAAVLAVQAGSDIMIAAYNSYANQTVLDALHAAISAGQITPARIAESVQRILMVKLKYGLLPMPAAVMGAQPLMNP